MDKANPPDLLPNTPNLRPMTTAKAPRRAGGCAESAQSWFMAAQTELRPGPGDDAKPCEFRVGARRGSRHWLCFL